MHIKTRGIVLHSLKYSDSASIATVYTSDFGRMSYMVYGVNKKKSVCRAALLQPLSIVELDGVHSPGKEIHRLNEMRVQYLFTGIPFDPIKGSVVLFISELLFRVLRQTEPDETLYKFLENSIQQLDCCETDIANFHLVFLMKLTRYFGFEPNYEDGRQKYFDLMNGVFRQEKPLHAHYLLPETTDDFYELLGTDYTRMHTLILSRSRRVKLLEGLIEYYRLHIPDFHGLNSLEILHSLFD